MSPGPLEIILLHPTTFPNTPYNTQCQHHTHRREHLWEVDIRVTTAANTGFRASVLFLADPRLIGKQLPADIIWSAVLNHTGAIATSTGTGSTKARFHVPSTTPLLSNAYIPDGAGANVTGFAAGTVVVYLLDPPIGITGNSHVIVTVLARVKLTQVGPITGYMNWTTQSSPGPGPGPVPPPQPTQEGFRLSVGGSQIIPLNAHSASAWLAGGCYWKLPEAPGADFKGEILGFSVYQIVNHAAYNWMDNDRTEKTPRYLVTWEEPGSAIHQVVGFENYNDAKNQADGETGLVPHGAECCIIYNWADVKWAERFQGMTDASTDMNFQLVYRSSQAVSWWKQPAARKVFPPRGSQLPATSPAPTGRTAGYSLNQPSTTVDGLTREIASLQNIVRDLQNSCLELMNTLPPSRACSEPDHHRGTPLSWLRSLSPFTGLRAQSTSPAHLSPTQLPTPLESSVDSWTSWPDPSISSRPHSAPAAETTQPPTGCRQLPCDWALPECPGCDNPDCDDCFEDDVVTLPSSIGSVDSLVGALSRLGGTDV